MKADDFAVQLEACAPNPTLLRADGLSPEEANALVRSFVCIPRQGVRTTEHPAVRDLLARYDVSAIEIGMVTFLAEPIEEAGLIRIGTVEVDPLMVNVATEEVYVERFETPGDISWRCAASEARFLDALLVAGCFGARAMLDEMLANDETTLRATVFECAAAAGGERYSDFYLTLFGCE